MATHSSMLAWRILMNRGAWQAARSRGCKESDTTEARRSTQSLDHTFRWSTLNIPI